MTDCTAPTSRGPRNVFGKHESHYGRESMAPGGPCGLTRGYLSWGKEGCHTPFSLHATAYSVCWRTSRGPKGEDDVGFWDAGLYQVWRDAVLGVIDLNPQPAVDDVDVRQRVMNSLVVIPAKSHQNKAVAWTMKDHLAGQITVRLRDFGVAVEDLFDDIGVGVHGSHRMISFFFGWKTTTRRT